MLTQMVAGRVYDYSHSVGRQGMGFSNAVAAALGEDNKVYVLNRGSEAVTAVPWDRTGRGSKVSILTIGTEPEDEEFLFEFGKYGSGSGEFIWPAGLALDKSENIYVTDEWLNRISVFSTKGELLKEWGQEGQGPGYFNSPSGIAFDAEENLFIVDSRNHRIQKFTKDGIFLTTWGNYGSGSGEFDTPWGITIDSEGFIYVVDANNHRVQKFTSEGNLVSTLGQLGTGRGDLQYPSDITIDDDGDVYVCDWANNRVQLYDADGNFLHSFVGDNQDLTKWSKMQINVNPSNLKRRREVRSLEPEWRFAMPRGVVFDQQNSRLMVVDTQRSRIQIYNKIYDYFEPQRNL